MRHTHVARTCCNAEQGIPRQLSDRPRPRTAIMREGGRESDCTCNCDADSAANCDLPCLCVCVRVWSVGTCLPSAAGNVGKKDLRRQLDADFGRAAVADDVPGHGHGRLRLALSELRVCVCVCAGLPVACTC